MLIGTGAAFGLLRGLRILRNPNRNAVGLETLQARVDTIHVAVARLAADTEKIQARLQETVTKDELAETLDRAFGQMERGVDGRFEHQTGAIEALRSMIRQTDQLLERVLEGLESLSVDRGSGDRDSEHTGGRDEDADAEPAEQGRSWNLSRAAL